MAAATQITAAVVSPFTDILSLKITPAPIKPTPVTRLIFTPCPARCEIMVKIVEPRQIRIMVRKPAVLFLYWRSNPNTAPQNTAMATLMASLDDMSNSKLFNWLFIKIVSKYFARI
jgi:hypothetical protein